MVLSQTVITVVIHLHLIYEPRIRGHTGLYCIQLVQDNLKIFEKDVNQLPLLATSRYQSAHFSIIITVWRMLLIAMDLLGHGFMDGPSTQLCGLCEPWKRPPQECQPACNSYEFNQDSIQVREPYVQGSGGPRACQRSSSELRNNFQYRVAPSTDNGDYYYMTGVFRTSEQRVTGTLNWLAVQ